MKTGVPFSKEKGKEDASWPETASVLHKWQDYGIFPAISRNKGYTF